MGNQTSDETISKKWFAQGFDTYLKPAGVIGVMSASVYAIASFVVWRIESKIGNEAFLREVARRARPFVIFTEQNVIEADGGAMAFLLPIESNPIEVRVSEDRHGYGIREITVRPKEHLAFAPLLEVLTGITRPGSSKRCANRVGRAIDAPSTIASHHFERPVMPKKTHRDQAKKHAYMSHTTHYEKTALLHFRLNQDTSMRCCLCSVTCASFWGVYVPHESLLPS